MVIEKRSEARAEIGRLERELASSRDAQFRLAVEGDVFRILATIEKAEDAITPLLAALCRPLGFVFGEIWEVDRKAGLLRHLGAWHEAEERLRELAALSRGIALVRGEGMAGKAWSKGGLLSSADPEEDGRRAEALRRAGLQVQIALPVAKERTRLGVVGLFGRGSPPDPADLWFLASLGGRLGRIFERRRQEKEEERLEEMRLVLRGVHAFMLRQSGREELFREVCRLLLQVDGIALAAFGMCASGSGRLCAAVSSSLSQPQGSEEAQSVLAGAAEVARAVAEHCVVCNNAFLPPCEGYPRGRSLSAVPLFAAAALKGILLLAADERDFFSARARSLLGALGNEISVLLDYVEKTERLAELALHDPLTGLANRTAFDQRLDEALRAAAKSGSRVAVVVRSVRQFGLIDQMIERRRRDGLWRELASRLHRVVNLPGNLARIADDRFATFRYGFDELSDLAQRTEGINRKAGADPFVIDEEPFDLSLSAGLAIYPSDGRDGDTLLRNAEAAFGRAKADGESYVFYEPSLNAKVAERLRLESRLKRALGAGEFVLHYQPKIAFDSGRITGAEALIRWRDPEDGLVQPLNFVPLLEETGLIAEVGMWVIREAFAALRGWRAAGLGALRVAVNVSAVQLARRDFVERVRAVARGYRESGKLDPGGVDIEITESVLLRDIEAGIETLNLLRAIDIGIAIDDFGTGYSSFGYLARLPVNAIKIDRSFIMASSAEATGKSIVTAIISLAHSLGLKAIAEGVETIEQAAWLAARGCDEMQGYLVSPPVPAEDMASLLARGRVERVWRQSP